MQNSSNNAGIKISIIGCGLLGSTLAHLLAQQPQLAILNSVMDIDYRKALALNSQFPKVHACHDLAAILPSDCYFITTPDDLIAASAQALLAQNHNIPINAGLVHCSGLHSAAILPAGSRPVASIHPIKAFTDSISSAASFAGTYCALEGSQGLVALLAALFTQLGAKIIYIKPDQKAMYHIAAVMMSNYLVGLHHQALACYELAGVPPATAAIIMQQLSAGVLAQITAINHAEVLTGPLRRGDINTIKHHLEHLSAYPVTRSVYKALGLASLALTAHPAALNAILAKLLT